MFSKAEIEINLAGENHFKPKDTVKGEVVVIAKKDISLKVLQCILRGELVITMRQLMIGKPPTLTSMWLLGSGPTRIETHVERHVLINNDINLRGRSDGMILKKGDSRCFQFQFVFPEFVTCRSCHEGTRLPSTNFSTDGSVDHLSCKVSATYILTATVEPDSTFGKAQGGVDLRFTQTGDENLLLYTDNALCYRSEQLWEGKIKKFVDLNYKDYGEENVAVEGVECIPNPLDEAHNHSRSVRKLLDSSYKKENYNKLVGDVNLELELLVKKRVVYSSEDVRDCFSLTFRTRVPNLQPDYLLYSKKSSQLGLFSIRSATVVFIRKYFVSAHAQKGLFEEHRTHLFNKRYGHELTFDIVDFTPNYQDPTLLEWTIPLREHLFPEKIVFSSDKPSYLNGCGKLSISHQLSVTLSVSDDYEETPRPIEFLYNIEVM